MKTNQQWIYHESKKVFDSKILKLHVTPITNERTGKTDDFYAVELPHCVCIIALTEDHKMVLIRQFRHGTHTQEIELPGGCLDAHESPLAAAARELKEETGFVPLEEGEIFGRIHTNPVICTSTCYFAFFPCVRATENCQLDDMENIETFLLPVKEVVDLLNDNQITHAFIVAAIARFALLYPQYIENI